MAVLIVILAFVGGALLAVALAPQAPARDGLAARLARIGGSAGDNAAPEDAVAGPRTASETIRIFLRRLGGKQAVSPATEQMLERAGHPGELDGTAFLGLRRACLLLFLALAPLAVHCLGRTLPVKAAALVLDLAIGVLLPEAWLQGLVSARQRQIQKALPDTLDLIVVSMEAGVGFDAAAAHAASALRGPLAAELARVLHTMRLGQTRAEALRSMARRVAVPDVNAFVAAVTQADRLGTGLAMVLRLQAETARAARMQRIRADAARLPTKMLFPLVFFLMPALFVVLLGPGLINLLNALGR